MAFGRSTTTHGTTLLTNTILTLDMKRRQFITAMGLGALALATPFSLSSAERLTDKWLSQPSSGKMRLSFTPYELQLRHAFNLAKSSRTTTPDVLVRIEYEGFTGYGEASMPPYLGESIDSACRFLSKVDLSQFSDPFRLEDILAYIDSIDKDNRAAKASIDIALHDLLGKIMGQPWYKIWGLNPERTPMTSFTIGIDTEEVVRQKVGKPTLTKCLKSKWDSTTTVQRLRPFVR